MTGFKRPLVLEATALPTEPQPLPTFSVYLRLLPCFTVPNDALCLLMPIIKLSIGIRE